jgi:CheY-like chemotaxis protein
MHPRATLGTEARPEARQRDSSRLIGIAVTASLPLAGVRVLVVNEHEDSRDAFRQVHQYLGATVTQPPSGHKALPLAVLEPPQLVLCDLPMPGMDGFAVLAGLRALLPDHQIRLVAVSGYGRDEDRRRTRRAGFDGHLVKPVDYDGLVAEVTSPGCGSCGRRSRRPVARCRLYRCAGRDQLAGQIRCRDRLSAPA